MYVLDEDTRAIADLTRKLVNEYQMPLERRILRGETLTPKDYAPGREAAKKAGLWALSTPKEHGGAGINLIQRLAITEETHRCLAVLTFGGSALGALYRLQGEQKARYLDPILADKKAYCFAQSEPGGGGDPARSVQTRARRTPEGWTISGTKIWISNYKRADFIFVLARTDPDSGAAGISMFGVEKNNPGVIARPIQMLGGMVVHELIFDDCRVDELSLVTRQGGGFVAAQQTLSGARILVAAKALAIASRAYEMMVEYSKQRMVFGKLLSELQETQSKIVDSWVELQQNRLLVYATAEKAMRGEDTRVEAGMVKMTCTEMCSRVLDRAIQIYGAAGCSLENPLAHWYNHERMARIFEGPTEVHKYRVLARYLLR